jgi:3-dehydroquinate synthase
VSDTLDIQSYSGPYRVTFSEDAVAKIVANAGTTFHVIVDKRVAELHREALAPLMSRASVLIIDAVESNKSLERFPDYVTHLLSNGIRRDHRLVAVGGGIIQDITCFLAATVLRGVDWVMVPTTLLAQADSCIGSKSSINCGGAKNILGTFTPPREVWIATRFLDTLTDQDVRSGIGEMLKVHAIDGPASYDNIAADYEKILSDRLVMLSYIRRSLLIKQRFIEVDEFDRGVRNVFNFGHSFGHAIEAATGFSVPHGIAVTIGMDVALDVGRALAMTDVGTVTRMRPVLQRNARGFRSVPVPLSLFLGALGKDKKNTGSGSATVILPVGEGRIERVTIAMDEKLRDICAHYFENANE